MITGNMARNCGINTKCKKHRISDNYQQLTDNSSEHWGNHSPADSLSSHTSFKDLRSQQWITAQWCWSDVGSAMNSFQAVDHKQINMFCKGLLPPTHLVICIIQYTVELLNKIYLSEQMVRLTNVAFIWFTKLPKHTNRIRNFNKICWSKNISN